MILTRSCGAEPFHFKTGARRNSWWATRTTSCGVGDSKLNLCKCADERLPVSGVVLVVCRRALKYDEAVLPTLSLENVLLIGTDTAALKSALARQVQTYNMTAAVADSSDRLP